MSRGLLKALYIQTLISVALTGGIGVFCIAAGIPEKAWWWAVATAVGAFLSLGFRSLVKKQEAEYAEYEEAMDNTDHYFFLNTKVKGDIDTAALTQAELLKRSDGEEEIERLVYTND